MEHKQAQAALLVMDVQELTMKMVKEAAGFTQSLQKAIETARSRNIPVIYAVLGYRKGYPEMSPLNKSYDRIKNGGMNLDSEEACRIYAAVAPGPDDVIVNKKRFSAFSGNDLEIVLRSKNIQHLVLAGISTSGVVLSTVREAADKDYALTVLSDCCADLDEEVHRVLLTKVFPRQADVMKVEEWAK